MSISMLSGQCLSSNFCSDAWHQSRSARRNGAGSAGECAGFLVVERSDNDLAGKILEDDAQIDPDQVDANRSSALVISAYSPSRGKTLSRSAFLTTVNMVRTLEALWAYERGAFAGSDTAKPGLIETAHTGTLFLDEITTFKSESAEQAFGVLQERSVQRIGRRYAKKIDLHLICATNDDLGI